MPVFSVPPSGWSSTVFLHSLLVNTYSASYLFIDRIGKRNKNIFFDSDLLNFYFLSEGWNTLLSSRYPLAPVTVHTGFPVGESGHSLLSKRYHVVDPSNGTSSGLPVAEGQHYK